MKGTRVTGAVAIGSSQTAPFPLRYGSMPDATGYQFVCGSGNSCPDGTTCTSGCCVRPGESPKCRPVGVKGPERSPCLVDGDCTNGSCKNKVCAGPSCTDGQKNGSESDTDCGGNCSGCSAGRNCNSANDCGSKVCTGGKCQTATCSDGVQNGNEKGVDCGGSCPAKLMVYVCPNFVAQGCCSNPAINVGGTCMGMATTHGTWLDTRYVVDPGSTYRTYNCPTCGTCTGCTSGTFTFTTPSTFSTCNYCAFTKFCTTSCTPPSCPP